MIPRNTICLWYDHDALEAATFYATTFPDSHVGAVFHAPGDYPSGKKGDVLTVRFDVLGIPCIGLNGGGAFRQSEAFSFQMTTEDQTETDRCSVAAQCIRTSRIAGVGAANYAALRFFNPAAKACVGRRSPNRWRSPTGPATSPPSRAHAPCTCTPRSGGAITAHRPGNLSETQVRDAGEFFIYPVAAAIVKTPDPAVDLNSHAFAG